MDGDIIVPLMMLHVLYLSKGLSLMMVRTIFMLGYDREEGGEEVGFWLLTRQNEGEGETLLWKNDLWGSGGKQTL